MKARAVPSKVDAQTAHVYRIRPGWKVFLIVLGLVFGIGSLFFALDFESGDNIREFGTRVALTATFAGFTLLGLWLVLWAVRTRVILLPDRITLIGAVHSRSLFTHEIVAWRAKPQRDMPPSFLLIPREGSGRKMELTGAMAFDHFFFDWLNHFESLDAHERRASEKELLASANPGIPAAQRVEEVQRARKFAKWFMWVTFVLAALGWFYPRPYTLIILALALIPPIAAFITLRSHGLYRLDDRKNDAHPNLAIPFIFPGPILALRAITDFKLIEWSRAHILALFVGLLLAAVAAFGDSKFMANLDLPFALLLLTAMYGYGVVIEANCLLDHASQQRLEFRLAGKHVYEGRRTEYRLELPPWGPVEKASEVNVSRRIYVALQPGDRICADLYKGALGIAWFSIEPCN